MAGKSPSVKRSRLSIHVSMQPSEIQRAPGEFYLTSNENQIALVNQFSLCEIYRTLCEIHPILAEFEVKKKKILYTNMSGGALINGKSFQVGSRLQAQIPVHLEVCALEVLVVFVALFQRS